MLTTYTDKNSLRVKIGDVLVYTFAINDRYNSGGSKRPRNFAITIYTHEINERIGRTFGQGAYVKTGIEYLGKLGIDAEPFRKLVKENGWESELPPAMDTMF